MRLAATKLSSIHQYRGFGDQFYDLAGQVPSLDLNFAGTKTLDPRVTFTRASSGTFVGSDGVLQNAVTNLVLQSEAFGTTWTPTGASVSSNVITAPNGTLTADVLIEDSSTGDHRINQASLSLSNGLCTYSVYLKVGTRSAARIQFDGTVGGTPSSALVDINLSTGITSGLAVSGNITSGSAAVSTVLDGWYRVSLTASLSAAATGISTRVFLLQSAGGASSYAGNGTGSVYLWGAQLEQSATVGQYIPTTSAINSAPRFDHNPQTGESLGLLVEEARTNSIRNNTMVGAVAGTPGTLPTNWGSFSGPTGVTRSVIGTGTQNGITYIDIRFNGTASGAGELSIFPDSTGALLFTSGTILSSSVWLSVVSGSTSNVSSTNLRIISYLGATYISEGGGSVTVTPTLTRFVFNNYTTAATSDRVLPAISLNVTAAGAIDITLRIGLPQLEQGAFATSVIPTTSATVTRAADVASITGTNFSSWYNQTEGTVFAEFGPYGNGGGSKNPSIVQIDSGSVVNTIRMFCGASTVPVLNVETSSVGQVYISSGALTPSATSKISAAYKINDFARAFNGSNLGTDSSGSVPTVSQMLIGTGNAGVSELNGTIKRLTFFPQRLPNSTHQQLTQ